VSDATGQRAGRVVVGVDGSSGADGALRWGLAEARRRRASLELISCWMYPAPFGFGPVGTLTNEFPEAAGAICAAAASRAGVLDPSVEVHTRCLEGPPSPTLVEASHVADLLVVGSRGIGGFKGLLLGSVGRHLSQHATCPLLIARQDAGAAVPDATMADGERRVVVGVDGSASAERALRAALEEAAGLQASLEIVHAITTSPTAAFLLPRLEPSRSESTRIRLEETAAAAAAARPDVKVSLRLSSKTPPWTLVDASAGAQLLVVGSRGLGEFRGMLLGSVSQYCAVHARCPVLIHRSATR